MEFTLIITKSLGTVLFFNCLFPRNNFHILVTQGGGGVFFIVLNGEAPSQGPTPYPFVYISTILTEEVPLL